MYCKYLVVAKHFYYLSTLPGEGMQHCKCINKYLRCLQILNIIRVLHIDLTSTASSLYSLGLKSTQMVSKDIKACN